MRHVVLGMAGSYDSVMGIYDRDYYRSSGTPSRFGQLSMMSVTMWLVVINVAVALLDWILVSGFRIGYLVSYPWGTIAFPPINYWGHFSVAKAIFEFQIWRFISFQFLHAGLMHLVFNMLMLYFFGPLIENYLGRRRFLAFYLICGIAGPFGYMILWAAGNATPMNLIVESHIPLVGASAGLFGILIAAAQIAPNATVLIYGIFPMRLRALAWVMLGIAIWTVFTSGYNAGGEAAHLGGAVVGWLLIRNPHLLNIFERRAARRSGAFLR